MTFDPDNRLEALISKATQTMTAAVTAMEDANRELLRLLEVRATRPWSSDEFARYLELGRVADAAHRRYLAGRHWFDNARRRRGDAKPNLYRS